MGDDLRKYVLRHFGRQGDFFVEELLQQTWIKVWRRIDQCDGFTCRTILAWIKQAALRTGLNMVRDQKKLEQLLSLEGERSSQEDGGSPCEETNFYTHENQGQAAWVRRPTEDQVIFNDLVKKWRSELTGQERKVLFLRLDGCSNSEIAAILNISRPRVSQYLDQIARKHAGFGW